MLKGHATRTEALHGQYFKGHARESVSNYNNVKKKKKKKRRKKYINLFSGHPNGSNSLDADKSQLFGL